MTHRFIPLAEPDLGGREGDYLAQCVNEGWVSSAGAFVTELETQTALRCGTEYAVATSSGTAALSLLLLAIGVKPGDYVIVPDWTFAASANAVFHIGAIPFLADVAEESGALDGETLTNALTQAKNMNLNIATVLVVHPMGIPADMKELVRICSNWNIPLIEDAAGALGSSYQECPAGSLADGAIISFNGNKIVTAGGGGMVVTNNAAWAEKARHLSTQAKASATRYQYDAIGYNYRLTNVCAAVGVAQIERLDEMIARRKEIVRLYQTVVSSRDDLFDPIIPQGVSWNHWMYTVRTASMDEAISLVDHLNRKKIGARQFWSSLSDQEPYSDCPKSRTGVAQGLSEIMVSLPCSSTMMDGDIDVVLKALKNWQRKVR